MKEIIEQMAAEELARANQTFPMFASWHEAYAVLAEEIEEAEHEMKSITVSKEIYWATVKAKLSTDKVRRLAVRDIRDSAIKGVEELIQVIAMCDKTFKSMGEEF